MMPVATALDQSGAGKMIANAVIGVMGDDPSPYCNRRIIRIVLYYDSIYV